MFFLLDLSDSSFDSAWRSRRSEISRWLRVNLIGLGVALAADDL
jgi:hypothetical protein